jgi:S-DNA-T family DNA segregation ATPase FtsK/SpoIIIE
VSGARLEGADECGFVYDAVEVASVPAALRAAAATIADLLCRPELAGSLRRRPEPAVWSALEYAGHLRDVVLVQRDRVLLALVVDEPGFVPMYRDERVGLAHYNDDDPGQVARELVMAAGLFARLLARLDEAQLARPCRYNYPVPARVDLGWVARHTLHEAIHHLADVRRVLDEVAG